MEPIIKEYVIEKIKCLADSFPGMIFKLGESVYSGNIFVEVTPAYLYNSNEYMLAEAKLVYDFTKAYEELSITFFNNDPYIQINKDVTVITKHKSNNSLSQLGVLVHTKDLLTGQTNSVYYQIVSASADEESYALAA